MRETTMRKMKDMTPVRVRYQLPDENTGPLTWLVWDEPLPMGKTYASGAAVQLFSKRGEDVWKCDASECLSRRRYWTAEEMCDHINFVKVHNRAMMYRLRQRRLARNNLPHDPSG